MSIIHRDCTQVFFHNDHVQVYLQKCIQRTKRSAIYSPLFLFLLSTAILINFPVPYRRWAGISSCVPLASDTSHVSFIVSMFIGPRTHYKMYSAQRRCWLSSYSNSITVHFVNLSTHISKQPTSNNWNQTTQYIMEYRPQTHVYFHVRGNSRL